MQQYFMYHAESLSKSSPGTVYSPGKISILPVKSFSVFLHQGGKVFQKEYIHFLHKVYVDLDEAKKLIDRYPYPFENHPIYRLDILKKRIENYTKAGQDIPSIQEIESMFFSYLSKEGDISGKARSEKSDIAVKDHSEQSDIDEKTEEKKEKDKALLDCYLHMDDALLSEWIIKDRMDLREKAIDKLNSSEKGSWLIRESSVIGNDCAIVRVLSVKKEENAIMHILIAHVLGLGYIVFSENIGYVMPNEGDEKKSISPLFVYPSFIDLLIGQSKLHGFDTEKMIRNKMD